MGMQRGNPESVIKNIDSVSDDTLLLVQGIKVKVNQTIPVAADTLVALDVQGKQLEGAQDKVDHIIEEQGYARRSLRVLASFFGGLTNRCVPKDEPLETNQKVDKEIARSKAKQKKPITGNGATMFAEDVIKPDELGKTNAEKYRQADKVLDEIYDGIKDLRSMAEDMGAEIDVHNKRLDKLIPTTNQAYQEERELIKQIRAVRGK
jgi:hypothetical protein